MTKNFKYTNTVVFGFDDKDDPARKELIEAVTSDAVADNVCFLSVVDVMDNRGVKAGDQFRCIEYGRVVKAIDVGFSFEHSKPFAVCIDDDLHEPETSIKYLDELLDIRRWAKMNQYKEDDHGHN